MGIVGYIFVPAFWFGLFVLIRGKVEISKMRCVKGGYARIAGGLLMFSMFMFIVLCRILGGAYDTSASYAVWTSMVLSFIPILYAVLIVLKKSKIANTGDSDQPDSEGVSKIENQPTGKPQLVRPLLKQIACTGWTCTWSFGWRSEF